MSDPIVALAQTLMRAVVASGAIRSADQDGEIAIRVMREEMKAFLTEERYSDERAIAQTGGHHLAMASLTTSCVNRILSERAA